LASEGNKYGEEKLRVEQDPTTGDAILINKERAVVRERVSQSEVVLRERPSKAVVLA
jgi:hypothetical protein